MSKATDEAYEFGKRVIKEASAILPRLDARRMGQGAEVYEALEALIDAANKVMAEAVSEQRAKEIMRAVFREEGLEPTRLAERAADELEVHAALDDESHPIWDWAIEVEEEDDEEEDDDDEEDEYE